MDDLFLLFIIILIISFIAVPLIISKAKKNDSWKGILDDKKVIRYKHNGKEIIDYYLYFRKDTGKTVRYNVDEEKYNLFEKGDNAVKIKGENYPVKQ
jgi:hypothetical protein